MKEENGTSQTVNYVAADILVRFSAYLSELGIDFAEEMKREQTRLSGMSEDGSLGDMKERLMLILQEGLRLAEHHRIPATKRKVQDARDFIDQNYHRFDMSLNLVAENIGVNASYLSNIFKKECGCSLSRYLSNIRLENAKRLMEENPVRTLMDISEAVGFSDVYYFSKNFKSVYGISPSKYQEELR